MMDVQSLWESAQQEISLEGCNGCSLDRVWKLVKLYDDKEGAEGGTAETKSGYEDDPRDFLKAWLWRTMVARRGKELDLAIIDDKGESRNVTPEEEAKLIAIKDMATLKQAQVDLLKESNCRLGVVAAMQLRLRALGLDTAKLKSITLVSPSYVQVLEVVGRFREWGADIDDVLTNVNAINKTSKKDIYVEVVTGQPLRGCGPNRKPKSSDLRSSGGMAASQLYPIYDRLTKAGLLFKSIIQKPHTEEEERDDILHRFTMLYLTRYKEHIKVPPGCRLEPTAKEVYLEMLVAHLMEVAGRAGAIVPWHNVRLDLFPSKRVAGRVKNLLEKESNKPDFPIRLQMLDVRAMDYNPERRNRRLEPCVSLKHSAELEQGASKIPIGLGVFRAMVAIIKSRGDKGANIELMRSKLQFSKKTGMKIMELITEKPGTYGVWKGYTREGRCSKVQSFFYDENLLAHVDGTPAAPPATPSSVSRGAGSASSFKPESLPHVRDVASPSPGGDERLPTSSPSQAGSGEAGAGETGAAAAAGGTVGGAAAGGGGGAAGELKWDGEDELDALVDMVDMEVEEAAAGANKAVDPAWENMVERRAKYEIDHVFPPPDSPEETIRNWKLMFPSEKRKMLIMYELERHTAVTVVKLGNLIRMMEGAGPSMHKSTLKGLVSSLIKEGKAKLAVAPAPLSMGKPPLKTFANGDMLVHIDAPTDPASMKLYGERFFRLETEVTARITGIREQGFRGERYKWDVAKSNSRFSVCRRRMHRTMILHRELLRCLPTLAGMKGGSRALDLDRVILDTSLSVFLTMFGYPPHYLHSDEMLKVLKTAEKRKATVRQAPRVIWELMRTVPWYKDALLSSLEALHDMKVLTKIDRPDVRTGSGMTGSISSKMSERLPYAHITTQRAASAAVKSGAKTPAVAVADASAGNAKPAAITAFENAMQAIAHARQGETIRGPDGVIVAGISLRGMRRDKRARSEAAESLLDMNDPPREMKMGLGWACLHVDLAVYTEDRAAAENKRVAGHIQWCDFWSTYQFYGTGCREDYIVGSDERTKAGRLARKASGETGGPEVAHPLVKWLLQKVPELTDPAEWGADNEPDTYEYSPWHKIKRPWTTSQDMALLEAVRVHEPELTFKHTRPTRPGRPESADPVRLALGPAAKAMGKKTEACLRRYRLLVLAQAKRRNRWNLPVGAVPDITMEISRLKQEARKSAQPKGGGRKRSREGKEATGGTGDKKFRKSRQTGLLAEDGPMVANVDESQIKAREQAAIAKAAGFEWVNEEGSWEEDGRSGGVLPRPFTHWDWTMDDLAAFTAVRQLLLVPENDFDPEQALERLVVFRPPALQKAYRALLSMKQITIMKEAWAASDYEVQDCVDYEVYKMIGRHGADMVTRGVMPARELFAIGFTPGSADQISSYDSERIAAGEAVFLPPPPRLSSPPSAGGDRSKPSPIRPARRSVADVGLDQSAMFSALEAIAAGRAVFNIRAPMEPTSQDGDAPGNSATTALDSTKATPATPSGDSAQLSASSHGDREVAGGGSAGGIRGGSEGGAAGKGSHSRENQAAVKYRTARLIDPDIMSTVVAEVRPVAGPGPGEVNDCGDAREVYGPEMEWQLSEVPGEEGEVAATIRDLAQVVKGSGEEGLSLSWLKRAIGNRGAGVSALGHALRSGVVVCLCGAEDMRYVHTDNAKAWIVPPAKHKEGKVSDASTPPNSTDGGTLDEDAIASKAAEPGWKGKKKAAPVRESGGTTPVEAASSGDDSSRPNVWYPWMTLQGQVDLRLLNRIRQGLVAHVQKHPGCRAGDVRNGGFSFLTGGETLLVLRDLARRKVLHEHAVPDTAAATLTGGWGVACDSGGWVTGNNGTGGQELGAVATTCFSTAVDWSGKIMRMEEMPTTV